MNWPPYVSAIAAFLIALACLRFLLTPIGRRLVLDHPNERSLHANPMPRTGGVAIALGVVAASLVSDGVLMAVLAGALTLAAVSLADDLVGLSTLVRLVAHLTVAALVLALELPEATPWTFVLLLLALAWYANLYNFMDGADGLAGGMALFGFGGYCVAAHLSGHAQIAALSTSVAAAAGAFLLFNFPPARIFLGDVGSVPLGFLAGALGIIGWRDQVWPLWFPVLMFAPFVGDATLTLARRLLRGERVWRAHREHYYQRLVRMGFGHRGTAAIEYSAMAGVAALALAAREAGSVVQWLVVALAALALGAIAIWVDLRWARHLKSAATESA